MISSQSNVAIFADDSSKYLLKTGLIQHVTDLLSVLKQLTPTQYTMQDKHSSIGGHMRHILEFMQTLHNGLTGGVVDYELRERNPVFETDPVATEECLRFLLQGLSHALMQSPESHLLTLHETPYVGANKVALTSSLEREILFIIQHGIHHLAIIKMLAASQNITLDASIGLAIATQIHNQTLALRN